MNLMRDTRLSRNTETIGHLHLPSTDSVDKLGHHASANEQESLKPDERETYVSKLINKFIRQVASSNSSETTKSVTRKRWLQH